MMMIIFYHIYIIVLPKRQVLNQQICKTFLIGRDLLRKGENMQKYNALKKLCLVYYFKSDYKLVSF